MKNNEYESVEHIDSDLTLMFENGKRYNVPHSSIYKRALKLQHIQQVSPKFHFPFLCVAPRHAPAGNSLICVGSLDIKIRISSVFMKHCKSERVKNQSVVCSDEEKGAFTER